MSKVPQIMIDIRLSNPGSVFMGCFSPYTGKRREKALEKEHEQLHKDGIRHINLEGSYDNAGNIDDDEDSELLEGRTNGFKHI